MKSITYLRWLASAAVACAGVLISASVFAKDINMYDQPAASAKVIGTIDLSTGVIPIFKPKGSDWVKIGDPRNGNVGWIKSSEISGGSNSSFSFTQKIVNDGKAPQVYKIEFGNIPTLSTPQSDEIIKNLQTQQEAIQKSAQKVIQEMMSNISKLYQQQPGLLYNNNQAPVILPIVIVPASSLKTENPELVPSSKK